jgi:putative ABC transport system permease protein
VTDRDEAEAYRILYEDIDNDQQVFTALAVLILFAAALAAFNLISRIVEAQRRELGIGMALGVPRRELAIRPLLIGVQIAVLGVALGVGVGMLVAAAMKGLLESVLPMPEYRTPFQLATFAGAAALGLVVPLAASAWPVWRAVRVEPVEAIRTGHLTARPGRFTNLSKRIRLPGSSLNQIPMRAVLRTPRRTLLTAGGVGAAIAALVAVLGMLDSFERAIDRGGEEVTRGDRDRVLVELDTFVPVDSTIVTDIGASPEIGRLDPVLVLPGTALETDGSDAFELIVELVDLEGGATAWSPSIATADADVDAGIVLAEKAAEDLDVAVGDTLVVRHPVRDGPLGFSLAERAYPVSGIHPNPIRTFAFLDLDRAADLGLAGTTNRLHAYPAEGATRVEMQRALFAADGVASTQAVARISEAFDEALATFLGFLLIAGAFVLVLALLIAFNSTRITVEERRREHATMMAYGVPVRSVVLTVMKESVVVGLLATLVGLATGTLMLDWILRSLAARTLPDFGIDRFVGLGTIGAAAAIGVAAVTIAPLFLVRRIRRMDLPSTLRVME